MPRILGGGITNAQIQQAVTDWLNENPPEGGQPPSDQQVETAVSTFLVDNPPPPGPPGEDGKPVNVRVQDGWIQYQIGDSAWVNIIAVADLIGPQGDDGPGPTDDQVQVAVDDYLQANPPANGQNATDAQVSTAVAAYLMVHPPADGEPGEPGDPGQDATDAQVASAVATYLMAHPPAAGKSVSIAVINGAIQAQQDGGPWVVLATLDSLKGGSGNDGKSVELQKTATAIQWRQAGGMWADLVQLVDLKGNPGNNGARGSLWSSGSGAPTVTTGALAGDNYLDMATGDVYTFGTSWTKSGNIKGLKGDAGPSPLVTIGTVNLGETAIIAITAGFRTLTITQNTTGGALTGLLTTDNVLLFPVVASGNGIPDGYAIHDAWCSVAGTLKVRLSVPLIALGNSYAIPCRVVVLR